MSLRNHKQISHSMMVRPIVYASVVFFLLSSVACIPKKGSGGGSENQSTSTSSSSNLFTVIALRVGSGGLIPGVNPNDGKYHSKYDPLTIVGACRGPMTDIQVAVTPQSSATVTETVPCNSTVYTWSKSLTTETSYAIVLTPLDSSGAAITSLPAITKNYVYDITAPSAPTFLTPTTGTTHTVSTGQTAFTITGQTGTDVGTLLGPGSVNIPLTANPDTVHQDYSYALTVPVGSSATPVFTALDYAGNSSTSSMQIISVLSTYVPVASVDAGSSLVSSGLVIHSNVGSDPGQSVNANLRLVTGAAGIVGGNP